MGKVEELKSRIECLEYNVLHLRADRAPIAKELSAIDSKISLTGNEIASLREELNLLKKKPRVSDHAVVRFLERKYGFDFENQRDELLDDGVISAINSGASKVKRDGVSLVIKDKTIVTII